MKLTIRLTSLLIALAVALPLRAADKPNIIFILADDMGYGDCSINNPESKILTPNIDQLAKMGVRFTDAHSAAAVCTPSRYGLLSGTCPARTDINNFTAGRGPVIDPDEITIADLLKEQGYATHMIGKWHLGFEGGRAFDFSKPLTGGPLDCGFDSYFGVNKAPSSPPYFYIRDREPVAKPEGSIDGNEGKGMDRREIYRKGEAAPGFKPEEITEVMCHEAVKVIRDYGESDKKQPFFLYYALTSPHSPWLPSEKFKGKSEAGNYGDFIVQLDDEVGRVAKALKETGLEKDTLIIFSSDNGPMWMNGDKEKFGHHACGVLKGHKASPNEGGHRVPFIARWPGKIAPGTVSGSTINFTDFFATLAEMFEVNSQKKYPGMARDSFSFYPALFEPEKRIPRPPMIVGNYSLRMDDWKLVARKAGKKGGIPAITDVKTYNLAEDISEQNDLATSSPERLQEMYDHYKSFLENRKLTPDAPEKKTGKQGRSKSQRKSTKPTAKVVGAAKLPNIVLMMSDDQGWGETSYNGHPQLKTPILDEMAATGLRFDRFYAASPVCTPTRASVLTGRHANRMGAFGANWSIRPEEVTLGPLLKAAGYRTAHYGKWHVGAVKKDSPLSPKALGFDESLSHDNFFEMNPALSRNGNSPERINGEGSEILVKEALDFVRRSSSEDAPFFVVIWFGSPHSPYECSEEDSAPYRDLGEDLSRRYGEIVAMDRAIGQFRDGLDRIGERANTLIWFNSDNGMTTEMIPREQQANMFNGGLRGTKSHMNEGGLRVPALIEWPAMITDARNSSVPCVTSDILPTLLNILQIAHPNPERPLDGISLKTLVVDGTMKERPKPIGFSGYDWKAEQENEPWLADRSLNEFITETAKKNPTQTKRMTSFKNHRHPVVKTEFDKSRAWIDNRYKLLFPRGGNASFELYDIVADKEESHDLASGNPEIVERMAAELRAWQLSVEKSLTGADYR